MAYEPQKTISGTWGEVWVDDYYLAEVKGVEATVKVNKTDVTQVGTLAKGYKVTGVDCSGKITLNKVTSYWIDKLSDSLKTGKSIVATIISNLADPDSDGNERVKFTGCTFDELKLANWKAGELAEEEIAFNFTGWEIMDTIPS